MELSRISNTFWHQMMVGFNPSKNKSLLFCYYLLIYKNYFQGYIDLSRRFTWVKCNKDFRGYYVTDYYDNNYEVFEYLLEHNNNYYVSTSGYSVFWVKKHIHITRIYKMIYYFCFLWGLFTINFWRVFEDVLVHKQISIFL